MSGARLAIGADGGGGSTGGLALVLVLGAVVVSLAWVVWVAGVGTIWLASFGSFVGAGGAGADGLGAEGAIPEELLCCSNLLIRSSSFWRRSDTSFLSSQELLN